MEKQNRLRYNSCLLYTSFNQRFNLGGQLNPRLGENFDPVVIVRIVAGRDHHAAAELLALDQIRHARRRAIA